MRTGYLLHLVIRLEWHGKRPAFTGTMTMRDGTTCATEKMQVIENTRARPRSVTRVVPRRGRRPTCASGSRGRQAMNRDSKKGPSSRPALTHAGKNTGPRRNVVVCSRKARSDVPGESRVACRG